MPAAVKTKVCLYGSMGMYHSCAKRKDKNQTTLGSFLVIQILFANCGGS